MSLTQNVLTFTKASKFFSALLCAWLCMRKGFLCLSVAGAMLQGLFKAANLRKQNNPTLLFCDYRVSLQKIRGFMGDKRNQP